MPKTIKLAFNTLLSDREMEDLREKMIEKFLRLIFQEIPYKGKEYVFDKSLLVPPKKISQSDKIKIGDQIIYGLIKVYNIKVSKLPRSDFIEYNQQQARRIHDVIVKKTRNISSVYLILKTHLFSDYGSAGTKTELLVDTRFIGGSVK